MSRSARLNGRTPLAYANTPALDALSQKSEIGMVSTIPKGMKPGSDTANLSVIGYDPKKYYSGRSPLEALSIGVPMKDTDIAMRCNIVTLSEEEGIPFAKEKDPGSQLRRDRNKGLCRPASCRDGRSWTGSPTIFMWGPATDTA